MKRVPNDRPWSCNMYIWDEFFNSTSFATKEEAEAEGERWTWEKSSYRPGKNYTITYEPTLIIW